MLFINNQEELEKICKLLADELLIAIDTEFIRRDSYFPKLSLVQIVTKKHELIIDYLAIKDLKPLNKILQDDKIVKILHSSFQDLEIFYHLFTELPKNIFDTQIAASICGYGQAVSYGLLCEICLNQRIDKTHQAANWLQRPLSHDMLKYAINDARYLILIYHKLYTLIKDVGLEKDLANKMTELINVQNYQINFATIWKKVRFRKKSENFTERMKKIAGYREECARDFDIPRRFFASDRDLVTLCFYLPTTDVELKNLRLEKNYFTNSKYKTKLLELCTAFKNKV